MNKILSGRFLFTVIAAGVFAYCAVTEKIPSDKVFDIINIVVVAYFLKGQNNNNIKGA